MSNIKLLTLMNLYQNGSINKGDNISTSFESLNKDYYINFNRKNTSLWINDNSYKYQCEIIFKNNLNIELLKITINEEDVIRLLDSVYTYMEFNMPDINIFLNSYSFNYNDYVFSFKNINNKIFLIVNDFNKIYKITIPKFNIEFNEDKLDEFLELLYYTFLIDLDNEDKYLVNPDFLY